MLNKSLDHCFCKAIKMAKWLGHAVVEPAHLLWIILEKPSIRSWLQRCLKLDVEKDLLIPLDHHLGLIKNSEVSDPSHEPSLALKKVLDRSIAVAYACGSDKRVEPLHVLMSIWESDLSFAGQLLRKNAIGFASFFEAFQESKQKKTKNESLSDKFSMMRQEAPEGQALGEEEQEEILSFLDPLTQKVKQGDLSPLVHRQEDLHRIIQILCRKKKCNPLLIGAAGVGKTTLIEGLAFHLAKASIPEVLMGAEVYALDLPAFLSGTKYRGDLERRFKALISYLKAMPHVILSIDEIHLLVGAGSTPGGHQIDLANLFKPLLARSELKVIGATTHPEYQATLERDKALDRRFQKMIIHEPNSEETFKILKGLKHRYETHHNVHYSNEVIREAIHLSSRYIVDRAFPDKALDLLDELGSSFQFRQKIGRAKALHAEDLKPVLYEVLHRPIWGPFSQCSFKFKQIAKSLHEKLKGQEAVIEDFMRFLEWSCQGGLTHALQTRTVGNLLFAGESGVGKGFLPKLLAEVLGLPLIQFDMSQYTESHAMSRLLGAPPGYVGHERNGKLFQAVREKPMAILFFDEIDKAHPDFLPILMKMFDEGMLTDQQGRKMSFQHMLIILTLHVDPHQARFQKPGFHEKREGSPLWLQERLCKRLSPSFQSRIDEVFYFQPLSSESLEEILESRCEQLNQHLLTQRVKLSISAEVKQWMASEALKLRLNARGMIQLFKKEVIGRLSRLDLLGHDLSVDPAARVKRMRHLHLIFGVEQKIEMRWKRACPAAIAL